MADNTEKEPVAEPRGFGERSRGLAGEYAHEQGWGLDVEERTRQAKAPQDIDGGTDYNYGAADFGDDPVNTSIPVDTRDRTQNTAAAVSPGAKGHEESSKASEK